MGVSGRLECVSGDDVEIGRATLKTTAKTATVHTERAFTISRGSEDAFEEVIFEIEEDGLTGLGEASPSGRYSQRSAEVAAALEKVRISDAWDIEGELRRNSDLPPAALAALDGALNDLAAKKLGVPLYRMLGLAQPDITSSYTLGIDELETTLEWARKLSAFPVFKMKVGSERDIETVRAVSDVSDARLWVDANEAFSPEDAVDVVRELKGIGVEMIEQPAAAAEGAEAMRKVTEAASPVPVIADESAISASDVPKLSGNVSGVNVKLAKCGGVRNALKMVHTARAHGMLCMIGCMIETSVGIAAASHIAGLFDFVDLDGAALLADDPFTGVTFDKGKMLLSEKPGLGVEYR
ncbi:MAG: dipeptide epimerase [Rubrobacteraceae bacterium]